MNNEVSTCDDLAGVNLVKSEDGNTDYISIEFKNDPEIQLYLTKEDMKYLVKRMGEILEEAV